MIERLPLIALAALASAEAAQFELDGEIVRTETRERAFECGDYRLKIVSEAFPPEYENRVPAALRIDGYRGPDTHYRRVVEFSPGGKPVPDIHSIPDLKAKLLPGRTYLATDALCAEDRFVIVYWSGGNCDGCEVFVEYRVGETGPVDPKMVDYAEIRNAY